MPPLKNKKHELFAKKVVENNYNLTRAHQETFPNSSYYSSNSNVHRLKVNKSISDRVDEIANAKGLTLEAEIDSLIEIHSATKPIVIDKEIIDYPDYSVRLQATQTGLKIHGVLSADGSANVDNRSLTINNISLDTDDIKRLAAVVDALKALAVQPASTLNIDQP